MGSKPVCDSISSWATIALCANSQPPIFGAHGSKYPRRLSSWFCDRTIRGRAIGCEFMPFIPTFLKRLNFRVVLTNLLSGRRIAGGRPCAHDSIASRAFGWKILYVSVDRAGVQARSCLYVEAARIT